MAPSLTHATRFQLGAGAGPASQGFDFQSCGLVKTEELVDDDGIRDGRSHDQEGVTQNTYTVGGPVVFKPRPDELDFLLDTLGMTETTDVWALDETVAEFFAEVETVGDVLGFTGLKANTWEFRSSAGSPELELEIDFQGKTMTQPALTDVESTLTDKQPYLHHQCVFTYNSVAYEIESISIRGDNALILDRFLNSQTRTELPEADRIIEVTVRLPWTSTEAAAFIAGNIGTVGGSAVWTNGGDSLTFAFATLAHGAITPVINANHEEVGVDITFQAYEDHSAGTKELIITSVSA